MKYQSVTITLLAAFVLALAACESTAPETMSAKSSLDEQTRNALNELKTRGKVDTFLQNSYGYAIFPEVTAGAVGVGGAYGKGELFEQGKMVGYCDMSQANIGAQLGGQTFSEIIFFQTKADVDRFKQGQTAFDAKASAVAADSGAAASADYREGVAVFTLAQGGLMVQAAIGGQQFSYVPLADVK